MAALIAAITIMQLVHERDEAARRPLRDAFDAGDDAFLRHLCASLEGKTEKQNPPPIPSPSPHGSSRGLAGGIATTENPDQSSCSTDSSDTRTSDKAGYSGMCESGRVGSGA